LRPTRRVWISLPTPGLVGRCSLVVLLTAAMTPGPANAQGPRTVAVGLKVGSVGLGGDVSLGLTDRLSVRGGVGWMPFEYDGTYDGQRYRVIPPERYLTLAGDLQLVGPLRLTGGLMHRSGPVRFEADLRGDVEIGDDTYTSEGRLEGEVHSAGTAPFLALGLGRPAGSGLGFYVDLGVAFTGDPELSLEATGPITQEPGFQASLEHERSRAEADLDDYYRYWPVVSVGLRLSL
jgi:hypothetical protein